MTGTFPRRMLEVFEAAARASGDQSAGAGLRLAQHLGIGWYLRSHANERNEDSSPDAEHTLLGLAQGLMQEAAAELSEALSRRGIRHFFVKGIALADRVYELGVREMVDIDVHVDPGARDRTCEALDGLGYYIAPDEQQSGPAALRSGLFASRSAGLSRFEDIGVDVAWGLDPVDRLLPRPDLHVPDSVWDNLDESGPLPVPKASHHVALIVHHMVHHDMLHFRGLVDLALLWPTVPGGDLHEIEALAEKFGVSRAARSMATVLRDDLGISLAAMPAELTDGRGTRARRLLEPVNWCIWASLADEGEFVEITVSRLHRRLLLLDSIWNTPHLLRDAVIPPKEYLRWRWPESGSTAGALARHLMRVAGKLF